jgi:hypothetical protein
MPKVSKHPSVVMPTTEENRAITAAAKSDPDAQPLAPKQLKAMVPLRVRPKSENEKLLLSDFGTVAPETIAAVDELLTSIRQARTSKPPRRL